ncbi:MAG TPA: UDP-glucose/GDP-mannose dehydrogenase family protein [Myxococcota bacterium]|jgi:UDPglucose 6-dehydrogenase/GDP-mannose 6-dehydrogenase|nr:UDP-glucose/GDP-mannose dehydrogenase family protein [Myxococcota bacterium]
MRVAIVGAGYVGLVTGVGLASVGHEVVCADVQAERVRAISSGRAPIHEPGLEPLLRRQLATGRFRTTTSLDDALAGSRISIVAVGTPPRDGEIDLSFVARAAEQIGEALAGLPTPHTVVVKSTVVPGTTDGLVREILERRSGLRFGVFGVASNPEFLREGSAVQDFLDPDRIVIGAATPEAAEALLALYAPFDCPKIVTTPRNAELAKYASNALLATLVSFSNEVARFCEAIPDVDVETVLGAVRLDRRLSPEVDGRRLEPGILSYLHAGAGFGGSCLPKDVMALRALGRAKGIPAPLLDAVLEVNRGRPDDLVRVAERELGRLAGKTLAVLGVAFKPGTDDLRESPSLRLIAGLRAAGAEVRVWDPLLRSPVSGAAAPELEGVPICASLESALRDADAGLIATAWPELRDAAWSSLAPTMRVPLLVDGRNLLVHAELPPMLRYRPIGCAGAAAA